MNCFEFAEEWKKIERHLRVFIGAMVFYPQERDDILQDTALAAWKKISAFNPSAASFKTWVSGIARFECLNYMHARKSSKILYDDELLDIVSETCQEETENADSLYENLVDCVRKLSPEKIGILKMKYDERMPLADIARKLGVSEAAVKEKVYRIKKELKSMMLVQNNNY